MSNAKTTLICEGRPLSVLVTNSRTVRSFRQARRDAWWVRAPSLTLNPNLRSKNMIKNFLRDDTGLELSEYAVAAALIAIACVVAFTTLGNAISGKVNTLAATISG